MALPIKTVQTKVITRVETPEVKRQVAKAAAPTLGVKTVLAAKAPTPPAKKESVVGSGAHTVKIIDNSENAAQYFKYLVECNCGWKSRVNEYDSAVGAAQSHISIREQRTTLKSS